MTAHTATAPPRAVRAEPPGLRAPGRDPYFDNAKYLILLLVACGHAWEPLTYGSRAVTAAYLTVYAFHMPAFALISGYFSRGFDLRPARLRRLVTGVLVPYVVFETAYTLFYRWAQHDPGYPVSLLDPWYLMWFLVALFIWRLTTPLWRAVRWPVPIALVIATLASVSPQTGGDLSLQRVLQFLPFFVVGLRLRAGHFERLRTRRYRLLALPVAAAALATAYGVAPWFDAGWFYRRAGVEALGAPGWAGLISTPVLFCGALVLACCFLAWVPGRWMWFTTLGAGTLYGYLLHGFLIKGSRFWDWYDQPWLHTPPGLLAVTAIAAAGVTLLCSPPVRRGLGWAMEPRMRWLFERRPTPDEQARSGTPG